MTKRMPSGRCALLAGLIMMLTALPVRAERTDDERARNWGFGWDSGLTVRRWLGDWELSLAAGPNDYLDKSEQRSWDTAASGEQQGALEVPRDDRREEGWVRLQAGFRAARYQTLAAVVYAGMVYNWRDAQQSSTYLSFDGLYDRRDVDRFAGRWVAELGFRPAWRPVPFLSIETAFGLRFSWENWSATEIRTFASGDRTITTESNGDLSSFQSFGWTGMGSLQLIVWF